MEDDRLAPLGFLDSGLKRAQVSLDGSGVLQLLGIAGAGFTAGVGHAEHHVNGDYGDIAFIPGLVDPAIGEVIAPGFPTPGDVLVDVVPGHAAVLLPVLARGFAPGVGAPADALRQAGWDGATRIGEQGEHTQQTSSLVTCLVCGGDMQPALTGWGADGHAQHGAEKTVASLTIVAAPVV